MTQFFLILGIIWLAVLSPGADFAMVSRTSFIAGRRAGLFAAAGIAIACWFHIVYAVFGLALVERLFPDLLDVIRIVGAAYLVYLGLTMTFARPVPTRDGEPAQAGGGARALATGILTNGLNPKTAIFVISLYAQVIGPDTPTGVKLGYGLAISLSHLFWFGAVAIFMSRPAIRKRVLANQHMVNVAIGCLLMLLGVALALADLGPGR